MLSLRPSKIFYSQDSINCCFDRKCSHRSKRIGETLDDLCKRRCSVSVIPTITVVEKNNKWFTCDNRRLWVFEQLERLGKCQEIKVEKGFCIPAKKFTTNNDGVSVSVRGNPGGHWHSCPTQVKIDRRQSVKPSTDHVIEERTQATIPSSTFSNLVKNEARDTRMSSYYSNPTPVPSKTQRYASDDLPLGPQNKSVDHAETQLPLPTSSMVDMEEGSSDQPEPPSVTPDRQAAQVKIDRQQYVRPSAGHVIEERTQATIASFSFSNSFKNEARDTTMSSYPLNPTPEPNNTRSYALDDFADQFQTRTASTPELFLKRQLRTRLISWKPNTGRCVVAKQNAQKKHLDKGRKAVRTFTPQQKVYVRNFRGGKEKWIPGTIVKPLGPQNKSVDHAETQLPLSTSSMVDMEEGSSDQPEPPSSVPDRSATPTSKGIPSPVIERIDIPPRRYPLRERKAPKRLGL